MIIKRNLAANYVGKFWSVVSSFVFIPIYINLLGFDSYSIISFSLVVSGLMVILDSGLTATLSRELARSDQSFLEKRGIFATLETVYFLITGLCIALIFAFSNVISSNWITSEVYSSHEISIFIKIIGFEIGFQLLIRFYLGGLIGLEKQIMSNTLQVTWSVFRNGVVAVIILFLPSLKVFFIWQAFSTLSFAIIAGLILRKAINGNHSFNFNRIERSILSKTWKFASGMLLISIVAALNTQMDKLVISKVLPIENLGFYTLAVSLSMSIFIFVTPVSVAMLPRFTVLFSGDRVNEAKALLDKLNIIVNILIFSIMACMIFFSYELIYIWTGNHEIAIQTKDYVPIISIGVAFLSLQIFPYNIAIANGYTRLNIILGLGSLFFTLPGYWIAISKYGAIGGAFIFCGIQFVIANIYVFYINRRYFGVISFVELYLKPIIVPFILTMSIGFVFSFIPDIIEVNRFYSFIWIGFSATCIFFITLLVLSPKKNSIDYIKNLISSSN
ncbi:lipopolysaccharide biosynthesis protein [Algoriphagus aquimarinus]|uniref:Membrane protein involved in the export of O-antigen and teichoic acid n=1 Tax=Algoriphagus aquimarinus TaxID=237018 RepID=A0A1I1AUI1_9BACT|nr:oligosaccharide flippase family protein [Algoriphagus aquimarinus]SFB41739.1 Membrane protein involved in the export of O-antigen and teichoic acid [Algoriphagus aquimarinus]